MDASEDEVLDDFPELVGLVFLLCVFGLMQFLANQILKKGIEH